jgi:hypothetical protein
MFLGRDTRSWPPIPHSPPAGRVQNVGGSQRPKRTSAHAVAGTHRRVLLRAQRGKQRAGETLLECLITRALLSIPRCCS